MLGNKKNIIIFSLVVFTAFGISLFANALELAWPSSPAGTALDSTSDLTVLVRYLYEWGIALGGLAAFVSLVMAGFGYLTSTGDPGKIKDAKDRATSAFLGLVLLLGSWLILNTINPELTQLKPLAFGPPFPTTDFCLLDSDCPPPGPASAGNPWSVKYKCTNGFCEATRASYSCSRVTVCPKKLSSDELWQPQGIPPCVGWVVDWKTKFQIPTDPDGIRDPAAVSIITFFRDDSGNEFLCGPSACGCTVQLFSGGLFSIGCGDMISQVPAWDGDLTKRVDQGIHCIRMISPEADMKAFPS